MPDLSKFQLEGCQVLEYARHKRKLRLGALKGNQFTVILREISDRQDVETRLQAIAERGVPNYFGAQRLAAAVTCRARCAGRRAARRCAIAISAVFGCRRPAARCLISKSVLD
jgi:hypothetical protein